MSTVLPHDTPVARPTIQNGKNRTLTGTNKKKRSPITLRIGAINKKHVMKMPRRCKIGWARPTKTRPNALATPKTDTKTEFTVNEKLSNEID